MNKTKLLAAFLLIATVLTNFSCNKKSDDSVDTSTDFFVKFKINGVQKEFKGMTNALFQTVPVTPAIYTLALQGINSTASTTTNLMGLNISDIAAVAINKNYTSIIAGSTIQASLLYFDQTGNQFGSDFVISSVPTNAVIRLSEITSTSVSGTFSGKVSQLGATTELTITEGSFRVKRL